MYSSLTLPDLSAINTLSVRCDHTNLHRQCGMIIMFINKGHPKVIKVVEAFSAALRPLLKMKLTIAGA